jgi:aromatic-L-amino-acid decarboxylase
VLSVWMLLRSAGRETLAAQISEDLRLARLSASLLREDNRLEVDEPVLSVVTFRHRLRDGETEAARAARDTELMEATLADGRLMLSTTILGGRSTLRMVVMNHRTTQRDVRLSVQVIREFV